MVPRSEQKTINELQANWVWVPEWVDNSRENTAGRIVRFTRSLSLSSRPGNAVIHCSADTRYKLYVNGVRVAVGPARGSTWIWYYDTLDIAPYLAEGDNHIEILVIRYFTAKRAAMPFVRTPFPGLTVVGSIEAGNDVIALDSARPDWQAQVDDSIEFPMGLADDVFLHISERINPRPQNEPVTPAAYGIKTLNGELSPWRLQPRVIPLPEETHVAVSTIHAFTSDETKAGWAAFLAEGKTLTLGGASSHELEVQAEEHSTAFLKWTFKAAKNQSSIRLKITYSEGYELEPRQYPFFRSKADRLDAENGHLIGPYDEVALDLPEGQAVVYEPFWFRTFRIMRFEITTGSEPVQLLSFDATQTNYPMGVKASWHDTGDDDTEKIWDVSIRTMRNCMFDGYSDCPFYEQLQYSGDSRSVGLFHYLVSGDDRLMRQAISNFAASVLAEGLTQSRFPSHVPQLIAGFSLFWVLQVCDHHLYFGDTAYARSFAPRVDGVLEFYDRHVDTLGLVSGFPDDVWQYVDWVTTWGATDEHPDKGVPTSGRASNRHTYFSMLYAYVLRRASQLVRDVGRPGHAQEYEARAEAVVQAVRKHCYDGRFFTDSTADVADDLAYSQHCQVFAVLSGAAGAGGAPDDQKRLLRESFADPKFSKCSYVMTFYALRAHAQAGDDVYEDYWRRRVWGPWRKMLADRLSTWEEDDVRQRSDCHAWGSVPVYEYCTELAGVQPRAPGCARILFRPRLGLSPGISARVALGRDNLATVEWRTAADGREKRVELRLERPIEVISQLPGATEVSHGVVDHLDLVYREPMS
ncbi:Six-hairpin glycosidase-like protein [Xylariomycetidae sp. FL2044]|nr:Six-hairpin glycosidase-like protein [Xylariomycetidae sp. FL2044]